MTRFTQDEQTALRAAGLGVYADRVITELQPPIDDLTQARIAARCAGPLPEPLLELWRLGLGGALDYDLSVRFDDHVASFSIRELFYPGSDHYRDLWGWIDAQLEFEEASADAIGAPSDGKLNFLPFGGFEYLDRLFVDVSGGPHHGSVIAWMRGLPPGWMLRLHADSSARIAPDLPSFFRLLDLEDDPFAPTQDYPSGAETVDTLEALAASGPAGSTAADKLRALLRATVLDWRAALDAGSIASDARIRGLAWAALCRTGDLRLLQRLLAAGCDPSESYAGGGTVLDHALAQRQLVLAERLMDLSAPANDPIGNGAATGTLEMLQQFLDQGAPVSEQAVLASVRNPDPDVGALLARALATRDPEAVPALVVQLRESARGQREAGARVASGRMGSNQTPAQYQAAAARLDALAALLTR